MVIGVFYAPEPCVAAPGTKVLLLVGLVYAVREIVVDHAGNNRHLRKGVELWPYGPPTTCCVGHEM